MRFDEYRQHDAISLAGLIAKGQVSANEVLEAAIARAEQVNPVINAVVIPSVVPYRTPDHRELFLSGLRLAAGKST